MTIENLRDLLVMAGAALILISTVSSINSRLDRIIRLLERIYDNVVDRQ